MNLTEEQLQESRKQFDDMYSRLTAIENQPDFEKLWAGRPKGESTHKRYYFAAITQQHVIAIRFNWPLIDWRGLI